MSLNTRAYRFVLVAVAGLAALAGCEALIVGDAPPGTQPPKVTPGTGGSGGGTMPNDAAPPATTDAGASAPDAPPGPTMDAVADNGGAKDTAPANDSAAGGAGGTGGVGGGNPGACEYPAGAPELTASTFQVGTMMPNLAFTRENGSPLTFKDIRCNKKHKLLIWSVGGDNCAPCVTKARKEMIPAWTALAAEGLFILESFNGSGLLVGPTPFPSWRQKTMWPMDGDGISLVAEPKMRPYYAMRRLSRVYGIPWHWIIDLETMKVVNEEGPLGVEALRARLSALPPRP